MSDCVTESSLIFTDKKEREFYLSRLECSVYDEKGKHCPNKVKNAVSFNDKDYFLCEDCLESLKRGLYGDLKIDAIVTIC